MTKNTIVKTTALAVLCIAMLGLLVGCGHEPTAAEVAAQYTEQTAKAIVEGSWKIAGALLLGLIINGMLK